MAEAINVETMGQWGPRRCETELQSRGGAGAGSKNGCGNENRDGPLRALRRCRTEPEARGSGGDGGESALCDEGKPHARGPQRGDTGVAIESRKRDTGVRLDPEKETREGPLDPKR